MFCGTCGNAVNAGAKFCSGCGCPIVQEPVIRIQGRLERPRQDRMIAGVCAGFAKHYGWEISVVRLVMCVALLLGVGTPVLAYLVAWIVMPNEPYVLPAAVTQTPRDQTGAPIA